MIILVKAVFKKKKCVSEKTTESLCSLNLPVFQGLHPHQQESSLYWLTRQQMYGLVQHQELSSPKA